MRYETIRDLKIPKIGFGTWSFGGGEAPDHSRESFWLAGLRSALELGYTHFDTAEYYAAGHTEQLLGRAVRDSGIAREDLFITSKVSPGHLDYDQVLDSCSKSLARLEMDYLDLYLIHWPRRGMNLPEAFRALNRLVREGRVRHLGVSNFDVKLVRQSQELCETPLLTNQVSYSIADRSCQKDGVLAYCQANDILVTAYTPVKRRNLVSNRALQAVARAHGVSVQQAGLAWLASQPRVIAIPMSTNPRHQADNLLAADLMLSPQEMEQLA